MFKNPHGNSAGKLIEEAALKGLTLGGAQVSPNHANFIVNYSHQATSQDIYDLSVHVQQEIERQYGITLEREVILIGRWHR
jgi:UDP-N-acetylmuramate dehydrogenase